MSKVSVLCKRIGSMAGDIVQQGFRPCDDCGHTNGVHPGYLNPSIDACVICTLLYNPSAALDLIQGTRIGDPS